ncbi:DUF423 domain-containing protein [Paenibacillus sp. GCM10023252]|uniref:DUF423 domain-containing protein n=1 Tax=Paenibacillus sp. GCM10023252 TaxID=3252649 RepID=UPI003624030A
MFPKYVAIGAIHAALAIALGAFGAHGLEGRISEHYLTVFETGVRYQMYHGLALILLALFADRLNQPKRLIWAGRLMQTGIILFSGSLYVLSLTGIKVLGAITPLGGVAFITAWVLLIITAFKSKG